MINKNLKYYRLLRSLSKKQLAEMIGVTPMAITHYENGDRTPSMSILQKIAKALGVKISDIAAPRKDGVVFAHNEFRKGSSLAQHAQEVVKESVEEYFNRFSIIVDVLGERVLEKYPPTGKLPVTGDIEKDAIALRRHLGFSLSGPIVDLIGQLENKGFLIYLLDVNEEKFFGINGTVDARPYIAINKNMSPERIRSTVAHELAHIMFNWRQVVLAEKAAEQMATAIGGAFLFPKQDAIRELGVHRSVISYDMVAVAKEYGISMYSLVKRSALLDIISSSVERGFYITANRNGWKHNEPVRIQEEKCLLFEQLVYRAISEGEISLSRGAELLRVSYAEVLNNTAFCEEPNESYQQ